MLNKPTLSFGDARIPLPFRYIKLSGAKRKRLLMRSFFTSPPKEWPGDIIAQEKH
jgi:hypothetical protein